MNGEIEVALGSLLMIQILQTRICFERIRIVFYTLWTCGSWYGTCQALAGKATFMFWYTPRSIASINTVYCYELMFHTPDAGHTLHHLVTILLQSFAFYGGFMPALVENSILFTSALLGLFSSILSSARTIAKSEDWTHKRFVTNAYYYSYLLAKPGMIIAHYVYWYANRDVISVQGYEYVHAMYAAVHLIQCYFSWKIVRVLWHQ